MAASEMTVTVVTPEETVLETTSSSVVLPLFDGEVGILRGHAPLIGRLGYGEMRLTTATGVTTLYVDGGFVQVADNVVNVMTNRAMPVAEINAAAAEAQLQAALTQPASGEESIAARQRTLDQARAQLRLAKKPR
jgi:F-type H+-transporting ATPase subunit epsilon